MLLRRNGSETADQSGCSKTDEAEHYFETQSDGCTTCKSPMGMFDFKIDNDLKMVDTTIREYYGFNDGKSETSTQSK